MTKSFFLLAMGLAALGFSAIFAPAHAAEPRKLGDFDRWSAYVFDENGSKVCYMASRPTNHQPRNVRRGDIVALITHRPAEGTKNVFSYMTGYPYKQGSAVEVDVDGRKFNLFTQNDMAWARDSAADDALADALQRGNRLIVRGESTRGTKTTDTFSLRGSTKAYEAISKECGV